METFIKVLNIFLSLVVLSTASAHTNEKSIPYEVLIVDPNHYDKHIITTIGYLHRYTEDGVCVLFKNPDAFKMNDVSHSIWLYLNDGIPDSQLTPDRWVEIKGVFSASDKGHWQGFAGSIDSIKEIEPVAAKSQK